MSGTLDLVRAVPVSTQSGRADARLIPALACGAVTAMVGAAGAALGAVAVFHRFGAVRIGWLVPLTGVRLALDPLGGLFMAIAGTVAVAVGIYTVGYARREHLPRFALVLLPLFVLTLLLVPAAGSVTTFLFCWELMALTSLLLVVTEHRRAEVRAAGVFYAVLTQLGFAALLLGLLVLSASAGADSFTGLAARVSRVPSDVRDAVFVLTLIGFGSKAGLLPLHAWLPRAHPEAPSPVSALMSAVMVNMGIYGILRIDLQLLGPGPRWWGLTLLIVGGLSAVFGVLHASVATDVKRLLAYSTTENMGVVTLALGAATMLHAGGATAIAAIALTAALLHLIAHAAFKTLAFLAAGSVLAGTGLRDLDRLGGLARRMPATTVLFGLAALGACGLPLGAGFVSEWLLLQAMIHAPHDRNTLLTLAMPLAVGAVALSTGLGVAAMVKAFGIGFLGRPRSEAADQAREASPSMLAGMGLAALSCVLLAVAPLLTGPALQRVLATVPAGHRAVPRLGAVLRLPGAAGSIAPGWLALALIVAVLLALGLARWGSRHRPAATVSPLWACGAAGLTPRMQYTATSFAEPLQRVFDDVLRPDIDVQVSHHAESQYLLEKVAYRAQLTDGIERHLYTPVVRAVHQWAAWVRRAHTGSVHLYLAYGALGLLIVLLVAR
jgi:hydrogenase-4 component B